MGDKSQPRCTFMMSESRVKLSVVLRLFQKGLGNMQDEQCNSHLFCALAIHIISRHP